MDSQKIKLILVFALALFFALYLGVAAATAQSEAIAWVAGTVGLCIILALGRHVWVLIPISAAMGGAINALPGAPPAWWAAMALVTAVFLARIALRTRDLSFRWSWLDFAIFLQLLAVGQAWLRNPSGLALFGGGMVGGKTYYAFVFAIVCYALLAFVKTDIRMVKTAVVCMIGVSFLDAALMLSSNYFPFLAAAVLPIYSGVDFASSTADEGVNTMESRVTGGKDVGQAFGLAAFTLWPPLSTLNPLRPIRFLLMSLAVGFTLVSGYRSVFAWLATVFIVASLIRGKVMPLVVSGFIGLSLIVLLAITGQVRHLPSGAQRALSFLPLDVDPKIRGYAESSTDWRVDMWILALTSDKYIKNKLLGDGFGFDASELAASQDAMAGDRRRSMGMTIQEVMLVRGAFHGFHVETIRMTGALGLLCALIGMGIMFRAAWVLIQHFRGRNEWGYVLYLTLPFLMYPFWAMLVFGSYRSEFPKLLVAAGMLKILQKIRHAELTAVVLNAVTAAPVSPTVTGRGSLAAPRPQPVMKATY